MNERQFLGELLTDTAAYVREQRRGRTSGVADVKSHPADLLTETDIATQRRIVETIAASYPTDAIMAEEGEAAQQPADRAGRCWICDPIDGTHNFVRSLFGTYAISLALVESGEPIAAGVALPELDTILIATQGEGTHRNGEPTHVSTVDTIEAAKIEIDFQRPPLRSRIMGAAENVFAAAGQVRSHGAAVVGLCSVATGDAEAYIHTHLRPWDCAAGALLIEEAGGRVTRLNGERLDLFADLCDILATNDALHAELLNRVNPPPPLDA